MGLIFNILGYLYIFAGVQCVHQVPWLPCEFTDENVSVNREGHTETQLLHREAILQFGQKGDTPVNPHAVTFLVTRSKVNLQRYVEGQEADQLECKLRRYSTEGIHVYWPGQEGQDYNRWFVCTLRQTTGMFLVTVFLRHPSDQPPPGQQDYRRWPAIEDRETLTTTAAMVMKTQSPSVRTGLGSQVQLHCQFAIDHKGAQVTVEWQRQHRGERTKLFSHASHTGKSQGSGVAPKGLASGDASYSLPFTKTSSEATYICSVSVLPLLGTLDISLDIREPPRVSLNVGSALSLQEGGEQKITCEAEGYYPLDVDIVWHMQDPAVSGRRVGAPLPEVLQNVLFSSHRYNQDGTYSLTSFFYLKASLSHSGRQFTCSVSHQSLRTPIKKSFILTVEEPSSWMFSLTVGFFLVTLGVVLFLLLSHLHSAKQQSMQKKPY